MRVGYRSWPMVLVASALLAIVLLDGCGAKHPRADNEEALAARTGTPLAHRACDHGDQDTSHYLHTPLYRACAVSVKARPIANDARPEFRATGRDRSCFSAVIQVAVDTAGFPESRTARVVRATDPGFADAARPPHDRTRPAAEHRPSVTDHHHLAQLEELAHATLAESRRLEP